MARHAYRGLPVVLSCAISLILLIGCIDNREDVEIVIGENGVATLLNTEVSYLEFDRELTTKDFRSLKPGSSLDEIIEAIGEPNGWVGAGVLAPYYYIGHGKFSILRFKFPLPSKNLERVEIVTASELLEVIELYS
ncbi:MAG: hypothetical protein FWD27_04500 [Coriobacteriia bacterium]|nr:hypothetical protein [Coriobacteriia bacterium]